MHITTKSPDRIEYFRKCALFTEFLFKFVVGAYFSSILFFLAMPIFIYLTTNEMVPMMPLFLPIIDETTTVGYTILTIYHIICVVFATVSFTSVDFFMAIIIISSLIFGKLISTDLEQINFDLLENDSGLITAKARLRNVLLMHQEMGE